MLPTQVEFEITQLLDGGLPPAKEAMLRRELESNPQAARLLDEHRRLDELLGRIDPPPEVDWAALQVRISSAVEAQPARPVRTWRPWQQIVVAASVLLALGIGMQLLVFHPQQTAPRGVAIVRVSGVDMPKSNELAVAKIDIGPAAVPDDALLSIPNRADAPARVVIAMGRQPSQDRMLVALAE